MVYSILYSLFCFPCQDLPSQNASPNSHQGFVKHEIDPPTSEGHLLMTKPSTFSACDDI